MDAHYWGSGYYPACHTEDQRHGPNRASVWGGCSTAGSKIVAKPDMLRHQPPTPVIQMRATGAVSPSDTAMVTHFIHQHSDPAPRTATKLPQTARVVFSSRDLKRISIIRSCLHCVTQYRSGSHPRFGVTR
jgi:hypothetical protein